MDYILNSPRASRTVTVEFLSNSPVTVKLTGMVISTSVSVTSLIVARVKIAPAQIDKLLLKKIPI